MEEYRQDSHQISLLAKVPICVKKKKEEEEEEEGEKEKGQKK